MPPVEPTTDPAPGHSRPESGWHRAADPDEVHTLLCASDRYAAARHDLPVPQRNPESSRRLVAAGAVHLLHLDGRAAAMFTLTDQPAFQAEPDIFPTAQRPAYLQRLAVDPDCLAEQPFLGVQCLRRAIEVAEESGADAIRAETNPDLTGIVTMMRTFGFEPYGPIEQDGWMRRIHLQKSI